MIAAALEAEVGEYVERFADERGEDGKRLVVRNGRARERRVTVGSGTVAVRAPRVNDKRVDEQTGERKRFSSRILPAYARRSPKVNDVLPVLYLRGLSTGDFRPALEQLLGEDAAGLSPSTISRLCKDWEAEHERFRTRSLRFHRYAYLFVDGVHVSVRLGEDDRLCLLVVIGVREDGVKELLAVEDGYRESTESWAGVMRDLQGPRAQRAPAGDRRRRARARGPRCATCSRTARKQTCWVHKIARVLDALPKRLQPRAKSMLHEIMEAPSRADARAALERFRGEFDAKYPKAVAKLDRDWQALTAFYDFPAEHWRHLRTSQRDREQLRDGQAAHPRDQGRGLEEGRARDGLQAARRRPGALAAVQRPRARRRRARRRDSSRTASGSPTTRPRRRRREGRRLITVRPRSTTFDNCSRWGPERRRSGHRASQVRRRETKHPETTERAQIEAAASRA